jgi:hypothetical protein
VQTLLEITGEKGLEKIREQYEKLYYALKKAHENERRLTQKCRQLNEEIADNAAKVNAVLNMSQDEQLAIAKVRKVQTASSVAEYTETGL